MRIQTPPDNDWQAIVDQFRAYLVEKRAAIARPAPMIVDKPSRGRKRKQAIVSDKAYQARFIHVLPAGADRPALVDSWIPRQRSGLWTVSGAEGERAA